jgi:DNA repair exonuclease SbcCD ATPase subunit
VKENQHLN